MKTTALTSNLISPAVVLLTLTFAGTMRGADYPATVLLDKPVGYWRLGESGGTIATNLGSLGPAANGLLINNVTWGQPGAIVGDPNTAANFPGASAKIDVPYAPELNATNFTMEVWARVASGSSGHRSPLTTRDDTPAGNTAGAIFYADPNDNWQFWNGRATTGWQNLGGATVSLDEWAHLVGTYDGTVKSFYVNGVLVGVVQTTFVPNRARPLRIGAGATEGAAGNYFFNGDVDEPAVYTNVLSPDQILAHYRAGSGKNPDPVAPAVVLDPQSLDRFRGDTATLRVLVTGSLPLAVQWKLNDVNIPGATSLILTLTNLQPANQGAYKAVVSNSAGSVTSADATLNVADVTKPVITQQPRSRTVLLGANVTFTVQASGSTTFIYQWQFNAANLPGATNATLSVTNVQPAQTGSYRVIVGNAAGSTTSDAALLQMPPPAAKSYVDTVKQDAPVSYWRLDETSGDTARDSVGSNPGTYLNGVTLGVPGALVGDSDAAASFASANRQKVDVAYTDALNTPQFTIEAWAKVTGGSGAYRSPVTSRADGPQRGYIFYADPNNVWQFWNGKGDTSGWDNLSGRAVVNNAWAHLVGVYDGTNKSFYVNGTLVGTRTVAFGPNDQNVLRIGGGATEGDGNYFFQGSVDEVAFYNKPLTEDRILAHYVAGFPQTTPPSITSQPKAQTVLPGSTVTLTVSATGGTPLTYQWKFNQADIPDATAAALTLTNVQSANVGDYFVVVKNPAGTVTSDTVKVQLPPPPTKSYVETIKADGPVGYWRLDEASGDAARDVLGKNDGTYLNGATLGVPGALVSDSDTAAAFQASSRQKVDVPFNPDLNPPTFSVEAWARVTGADGTYRSPVTSRGNTPQQGYIFYADTANTWQFWTGNGDPGGWNVVAGPPVVKDAWTYLVGTFDGTTKRFYVNALEVGSALPTFGVNGNYPLRIGGGATEGDGNYFFEGSVDEVAVYSKVLTPDQIVQHFVAGRFVASATPTLSVARIGTNLVLTWAGGTLQEAADITGAWLNVAGATSPLTVTPSGARKFYRVKQ